MIQLILHLLGDYVFQSDWMAQRKTKSTLPAAAHALVYSLPFLLLGSWQAWLVIMLTHFVIDRWRLARYVCWAKNFLAPPRSRRWKYNSATSVTECIEDTRWWHPWEECSGTGYHKDSPAWLSVWLMIIADNTMHLAINYFSLLYL